MQLKSKSTHSSPRSCSKSDRAFCEGWFCICEAEKGGVSGYADCRQRSVCKIQTSRMHGLFRCRSGYRQILLNALYIYNYILLKYGLQYIILLQSASLYPIYCILAKGYILSSLHGFYYGLTFFLFSDLQGIKGLFKSQLHSIHNGLYIVYSCIHAPALFSLIPIFF